MQHLKLRPLALGLSIGILWGIAVLIFGLLAYFVGYGELFVTSMGTIYLGYDATIAGSIIGGVIAFVDGLITGVIVAWLYNLFAR